MKADDEKKLEKNDLAEGLKAIAAKAKSANASNFRFVLLLLVLGAIVGAWWYLRGSGRKSDAETWRQFESLGGADDYEKFAETYANTLPGRAADLQRARILLAQGVNQLTAPSFDVESRKKTIEKIETARDLFVKLADEFKTDLALRAQALEGAAKAEISLVGVPKSEGSLTEFRGSVKKAADYYREYAKTVGETTTIGEAALKKAGDWEAHETEINSLGSILNTKYSPKPAADIKLPDGLTPPKNPLQPSEPTAPGKVDAPKTETPIPPPTPPGKIEPEKKDEPKDQPKGDPKSPTIPPPAKSEPPKDKK